MQKHKSWLVIITAVLALSTIFCASPGQPNADKNNGDLESTMVVLAITQTALAAPPTPTTASPPTATLPPPEPTQTQPPPTAAPTHGSISGQLSFPSEMIPPLRVVAFHQGSSSFYFVETAQNQTQYTIQNLVPGFYQVVAYTLDGPLAGGYTHAVPCGLSVDCTDHSLIDVSVIAGQDTTDVHPGDWYAPDGSFPLDPLVTAAVNPPADIPDNPTASISGNLSFPSESIPPLRVVAFRLEDQTYYFVDTAQNQTSYEITGLPPGTYHVVAYADAEFGAGYSQAVPCGLSVDCSDHSLIDIPLAAGQKVSGIDPGDWYAPEGSFPPNPAP